jgi:hypothetical protein
MDALLDQVGLRMEEKKNFKKQQIGLAALSSPRPGTEAGHDRGEPQIWARGLSM